MKNYRSLGTVQFPAYAGICINMMPFVMGNPDTLPAFAQPYAPLIAACDIDGAELGKVGYLSISESFVSRHTPQRRGGVHVEKHPESAWGGGGGAWGGKRGGLYMASTVNHSCRVWDANVDVPGAGGDCSHLLPALGNGRLLTQNELVWLTDSCPHESLPVAADTYRQWFRVVTSEVGLWYRLHSTANPLGIEPGCRIIETSKFA